MIDEKVLIERLEKEMLQSTEAKAEAIIGMCGVSANVYCGEVDAYNKAIQIIKDLAEEHNNVIIDEQYCWQTCGSTEHCKECRRLSNGDIDYYENYDFMVEEHNNTWKQQTMSRFERVE